MAGAPLDRAWNAVTGRFSHLWGNPQQVRQLARHHVAELTHLQDELTLLLNLCGSKSRGLLYFGLVGQ
jgi:hypothetical protein